MGTMKALSFLPSAGTERTRLYKGNQPKKTETQTKLWKPLFEIRLCSFKFQFHRICFLSDCLMIIYILYFTSQF